MVLCVVCNCDLASSFSPLCPPPPPPPYKRYNCTEAEFMNVEVSEHNLESSQTWVFCMDFLNQKEGLLFSIRFSLLSPLQCTVQQTVETERGCVSLKKYKSDAKLNKWLNSTEENSLYLMLLSGFHPRIRPLVSSPPLPQYSNLCTHPLVFLNSLKTADGICIWPDRIKDTCRLRKKLQTEKFVKLSRNHLCTWG